MPTLSDYLYEFANLTKTEQIAGKDTLLENLGQAYRENRSARRRLVLPPTSYGIGSIGAECLGKFIEAHSFRDIVLPAAGFYNPKLQKSRIQKRAKQIGTSNQEYASETAFNQFVAGLVKTKDQAKLNTMNLSDAKYPTRWLVTLARDVICDHPSLHTLILENIFLTDELLDAILPYLKSSKLQVLVLADNNLTGHNLPQVVDQIQCHCPNLHLLDLTGNELSTSVQPLLDWLEQRPELSIGYPSDERVRQASLTNHVNHYLPNQVALAMHDFKALVAEVTRYQDTIENLKDNSDVASQLMKLTQGFDQHKKKIHHDLFQQALVQAVRDREQRQSWQGQHNVNEQIVKSIAKQGAQINEAEKQAEQAVQRVSALCQEVAVMNTRVGVIEGKTKTLRQTMIEVQNTLEVHEDQFDDLYDSMGGLKEEVAALLPMIDQLYQAVESLPEKLVQDQVSYLQGLSEEQQTYVRSFRQQLVQMHLAAMVVSTGLVGIKAETGVGRASNFLNVLGGVAPMGTGLLFNLLSSCLEVIDGRLMSQRIDRLVSLADTPEVMARRAGKLGAKLAQCLSYQNLAHKKRDNLLSKLLSTVKTAGQAQLQGDLDDAMVAVVEDSTNHALDVMMPDDEPRGGEERGVEDSRLLLTLIMVKGFREGSDSAIDAQLFLYAAPLIAIADTVFIAALIQYCEPKTNKGYRFKLDDVTVSSAKRHCFSKLLCASWRTYPEPVTAMLTEHDKKSAFLEKSATAFCSQGLFHLKSGVNLSVLPSAHKPHISVCNEMLTQLYANDITKRALGC